MTILTADEALYCKVKKGVLPTVPATMRNQPVHSSSAIYASLSVDPQLLTPARQRGWEGRGRSDDQDFSLEKEKRREWGVTEDCQAEDVQHTPMQILAHNFTTVKCTGGGMHATTWEHNLWRIVMWHSRLWVQTSRAVKVNMSFTAAQADTHTIIKMVFPIYVKFCSTDRRYRPETVDYGF